MADSVDPLDTSVLKNVKFEIKQHCSWRKSCVVTTNTNYHEESIHDDAFRANELIAVLVPRSFFLYSLINLLDNFIGEFHKALKIMSK